MHNLTRRQSEVLETIRRYQQETGIHPPAPKSLRKWATGQPMRPRTICGPWPGRE